MTEIKHVTEAELQRLYRVLAKTVDAEQVKVLLDDLCTIREVHEMAQRLSVAFMLDAGVSYTVIQDKTGTSATTIARVSKCLNYGGGGYRSVIDDELGPGANSGAGAGAGQGADDPGAEPGARPGAAPEG